MNQTFFKYAFLFLILVLFSSNHILGQYRADPFSIESSNLFEEMRRIKSENPKITAEEFANQVNSLLSVKGMNFVFSFDADVCRLLSEQKQKQKDQKSPFRPSGKINSVAGDIASVRLTEVKFDNQECGRCYFLIPLLQFDNAEFITLISNRNIRFYTPPNLVYYEISLVNEKDVSKTVRSWKIPFRTTPLSISEDGTTLMLDLNQKEFSDIVLLIYDEGNFQFYPKKDLDLSVTGTILNETQKEANLPGSSFVEFARGDKKQILKISNNCK